VGIRRRTEKWNWIGTNKRKAPAGSSSISHVLHPSQVAVIGVPIPRKKGRRDENGKDESAKEMQKKELAGRRHLLPPTFSELLLKGERRQTTVAATLLSSMELIPSQSSAVLVGFTSNHYRCITSLPHRGSGSRRRGPPYHHLG
jgi:hypothetical protein